MGLAWWAGLLIGPAIINFFFPISSLALGFTTASCGIKIPSTSRAHIHANRTRRARRLGWAN